ncbi:hypothetical protein MTO96_032368 [Rhipicephalus appendiculatus]
MDDYVPTEQDAPAEGAASAAQVVSSVAQGEAHATSEGLPGGEAPYAGGGEAPNAGGEAPDAGGEAPYAGGEAPELVVADSNAAQTDTGSKPSRGKTSVRQCFAEG